MSIDERKGKSAVWWMVGIIVCLVLMGFFLLTYEQSVPVEPTGIAQMQEMAQQVQGMETTVQEKENEIKNLAAEYQQKTGTATPVDVKKLQDLGPQEKELLEQKISNEKNVSIRGLLQEILRKGDEISQLKERIADIESVLPRPHIAVKGETHYQVALDFLMKDKGLSKIQAQDLLSRTALFEELLEGFKVWNFYNGIEFGSSVTQGDALVSPTHYFGSKKKKLVSDFGEVVTQRNQLANHYEEIVSERDRLVSEYKSLESKQKDIVDENEHLAGRLSELDKELNALHYCLDLQRNLEKRGILKRGFLRAPKLNDITPSDYDRSLDLAIESELVISADTVGIEKIKNVVLYPKTYKRGSSYEVLITPNQKHALITLVDKNKFKSERVVIAIQ